MPEKWFMRSLSTVLSSGFTGLSRLRSGAGRIRSRLSLRDGGIGLSSECAKLRFSFLRLSFLKLFLLSCSGLMAPGSSESFLKFFRFNVLAWRMSGGDDGTGAGGRVLSRELTDDEDALLRLMSGTIV